MAPSALDHDRQAPTTWPHALGLFFLFNHLLLPFDTWIADSVMSMMYDQGDSLVVGIAGHALLVTIYTIAAQITHRPSVGFVIYKTVGLGFLCLFTRLIFDERSQDNGLTVTMQLRDIAFTGCFNALLLQLYITPPMPSTRRSHPIIWNGSILFVFLCRHSILPDLFAQLSIQSWLDFSLPHGHIFQTMVLWPYLVLTEILLRSFPFSLARLAIARGPRRRAIVTTANDEIRNPVFVFRLTYLRALFLLLLLPTIFSQIQRILYAISHPVEIILHIWNCFGNATVQSGRLVRLIGRSLRLALSGSAVVAVDILRDEFRKDGLVEVLKAVETFGYFVLTIVLPYQAYLWARDGSAVLRWLRCFVFGE